MRYNDVRDGTTVIEDVLGKYKAAWDKKGLVREGGLFPDWWLVKQDHIVPPRDVAFTAWACAFMNTWNHELIESLYAKQSQGFITNIDGQIRLQTTLVANAYRQAATASSSTTLSGTSSDQEVFSKAILQAKQFMANPNSPKPPVPYTTPTFGYVVKWLSELGKEEELNGLLNYADQNLKPTWEDGGLYYPRNDTPLNENLEWTHMDPFSGNAAIGYARLNVPNGQKTLWEQPLTRQILNDRPWVDNLDLGDVAVVRGAWDEKINALIVTVRGWDFLKAPGKVALRPVARNLPAGSYAVYVKGKLTHEEDVQAKGSVQVSVDVAKGEEVDIVVLQV